MNEPESIAVTVRLLSILRHRDGEIIDRLYLQLPLGSRVSDALRAAEIPANIEFICTVNGEVAHEDVALNDGDQLSLIPIIAGGRMDLSPSARKQLHVLPFLLYTLINVTTRSASFSPPPPVHLYQHVVFT